MAASTPARPSSRNYGMAWGVGGWLLTPFLQKIGRPEQARLRERVVNEPQDDLRQPLHQGGRCPRRSILKNIAAYGKRATGEKFLINPNKWPRRGPGPGGGGARGGDGRPPPPSLFFSFFWLGGGRGFSF